MVAETVTHQPDMEGRGGGGDSAASDKTNL